MSFRTEIVTTQARLFAVRDAWQGLWDSAGTFVFQTNDWIAGWLTGMHDRKEVRLQIAIAWDGDVLVGIMPCAIYRRSGLRTLRWAAELFSDYCDCILDPAYSRSILMASLWDGMWRAGGFDVIALQQVRPDGQCRLFLDAKVDNTHQLQLADRQVRCMRIDNNWPNGKAFFRSLNKKARNNHTRGRRILSELGGEVAFEVIEPGQPAGSAIDEMIRLKETWLRVTDPNSPLLNRDAVVLRTVLEGIWRSGMAKIFLLTCGGKIAATSFNFVYANRMEAYLTSYDATYERASPGTILIVEYAQWSFDRGLHHVDFLRGEEAFKFRMTNAETLLSGFSGARTLVGQIAISGHKWLARRRQRQEEDVPQADDALEAVG